MTDNYHTAFPSPRGKVSAEEWEARVNLAACYRLVDRFGMTDLICNHITARIPGSEEHLLINLYGVLEWHAMLRLLHAEERNSGYSSYQH